MKPPNAAILIHLVVFFLLIGTGEAQATVTITSATVNATFSSIFNSQTQETDFALESVGLSASLSLDLSPIDVSFVGSVSSSWADASNWSGYALAIIDSVQIGTNVVNAAQGGPLPAFAAAADGIYNALGTSGGPTEKTVSSPAVTFTWKPSASSASVSTDLSANLNVKFNVTIPSGTVAVMDQIPVVLENLTNAGNLAGNGNGLTVHQNFQNTGVAQNFGGSIAGSFSNANGASITVAGSLSPQADFQNNGTIIVPSNGSLYRAAATTNNGTITIQNGQFSFSAGLTDYGMIDGYGFIGMTINEFGTLAADVAGQTLTLGSNVTPCTVNNSGTISVTNGARLVVSYSSIKGGAITANGGTVNLGATSINGCTLNGGAEDLFTVSTSDFVNVINNAQVLATGELSVSGSDLVNNGSITVSKTTLDLSGNVSVSGGGTITLSNGTFASSNGAVILSQLIHGYGFISGTLNSSVSIAADGAGQTLTLGSNVAPCTVSNSGIVSITNGARLVVSYSTINGGAITANGGTVSLGATSINGCTLNGGVNDLFTASTSDFVNVINNAQVLASGELSVSGSALVNNGSITVSNTTLDFSGNISVSGSGTVTLTNGTFASSNGAVSVSQPIHGYGFMSGTLNSSVSIAADVAGQTLNLGNNVTPCTVNNSGVVSITNGARLVVSYSAINGGTIIANGGTVSLGATSINGCTLNGGGTDLFTVSTTSFVSVINNAQILASGSLSISGGALTNNGNMTVANGASMYFSGNENLVGTGVVTLNGGSVAGSGGTVTQGLCHTLTGVGTVGVPFSNSGRIAPGITFGTLTFSNGLSLLASSHVIFTIGGISSTSYDRIAVTGAAQLNGSLDLKVASSYAPKLGDTFQIMTFGSQSGSFVKVKGLLINEDFAFAVTVNTNNVTLTVVSTAFAAWKASKFGLDASNPSIAGGTADPDHDGIPNLLEYAFGLDPNLPSRASLPLAGYSTSAGSTYATFSYRRLITTSELVYTVGVSSDLLTWDWSQTQIQQVGSAVPTGDGLTEIITIQSNSPIPPSGGLFLCLSVSQSL